VRLTCDPSVRVNQNKRSFSWKCQILNTSLLLFFIYAFSQRHPGELPLEIEAYLDEFDLFF
jgi:hypothetical protein